MGDELTNLGVHTLPVEVEGSCKWDFTSNELECPAVVSIMFASANSQFGKNALGDFLKIVKF
jgi:hypothetical protein